MFLPPQNSKSCLESNTRQSKLTLKEQLASIDACEKIFKAAISNKFDKVIISTEQESNISMFTSGDSARSATKPIPKQLASFVISYLAEHSIQKDSNQRIRTLILKTSALEIQANLTLGRNSAQIENISETINFNFDLYFSFSKATHEKLNSLSQLKRGIILANSPYDGTKSDGASIASIFIKNSLYTNNISSEDKINEVINYAEKYPVIIGRHGVDCVDILSEFISEKSYSNLLQGVFINLEAKKLCQHCLKSTALPTSTAEQIPKILRPLLKEEYPFSRGCEQCNYGAYVGVTGIQSVLVINEELKSIVTKHYSIEEVATYAYKNNTRSLLEDGITKIYQGLTSFEEVMSQTKNVSRAFTVAAENEIKSKTHSAASDSKKLLIIEDDSDQRQILEIVFQSEGYSVVCAENGKKALDLLEDTPVDIIICDVMMPVMNGIEFVKQLRNKEDKKSVPVLMLTAAARTEDEAELIKSGANDFCEKKVKKNILLKRVSQLLAPKTTNPVSHLLND